MQPEIEKAPDQQLLSVGLATDSHRAVEDAGGTGLTEDLSQTASSTVSGLWSSFASLSSPANDDPVKTLAHLESIAVPDPTDQAVVIVHRVACGRCIWPRRRSKYNHHDWRGKEKVTMVE